jgi:peptidoglycan/LPS O-acetylase OafA/YrhL
MTTAPPATPPTRRYHSLDLWRAFACLLVVISHSIFYRYAANDGGGLGYFLIEVTARFWLGVPLFFVISGYCITAAANARRGEERPLREYLRRRVRRIYPPYWIAVALAALFAIVIEALRPGLLHDRVHPMNLPTLLSPSQWFGVLTLTETWRPLLGGPANGWVLGAAWSLCYEEQFYLVTGLALLLPARRFFPALFGLAVLVVVLLVIGPHPWMPVAGTLFDGRWLQFAAGVAVYYYLHEATPHARRATMGILIAALVWSVVSRHHAPLIGKEPLERIVAILFSLVLIGLYRYDDAVRQCRWLRPSLALGTITYSLYLIHWPFVKLCSHLAWDHGLRSAWETLLIVIPACIALSLAAGYGFYLAVERHWLNSSGKARG